MPTITIDGRPIEVAAGSLLLPVALEHGIHIPHYCWHPKLSVDGSCRMCQVEVEGSPKLVIACNTPVRDGMVVRTDTPAVQEARRGVMELLLVNHPLDCPICDKAGECLLQDYSYAYGSRETHTREPRRKLEKRKSIGPRMILDQERCILCRRCVRFCREIARTNELGTFNMGDRTVLDILPDRPLANDYSICTADVCPVGALESKDFHHRLRVWFLKKTPSVCPSCSNGCNITVQHHKGRIWRLMPRRNDAVNDTWMCDHGRLNYGYVQSDTRLRTPLLRRDGRLAPATWDEALAAVADRLRSAATAGGASSVGAVASPHLTNEELFRFAQLLRALNVVHVDVAVRTGAADGFLIRADKAANARGARDMGLRPAAGGHGLPALLDDTTAGTVGVLYVCGPDLTETADPERLARALDRVEYLIVQDVAGGPLAERAQVVLPSLTFAEKNGTFTNHAGRVQRLHRAFAPADDQPADGEIFTRLLNLVTGANRVFDPAQTLEEIATSVPAYAGISLDKIGALGWPLADAAAPQPEAPR
ncbi:molybdopterin-dependent oxidoreductase [Candidatus Binatia bacterium]|nr:molybdopterin-dependent oxidoreductase [Candidatus Binatia bacterium]